MSEMTRVERVLSVLRGTRPDHPPVSFWHHFPPDAVSGPASVEVHLRHLSRYNLDWLKIMNDNPYPFRGGMDSVAGLRDIPVLTGEEGEFGAHLEVIRALVSELCGRVLLVTTLFNSWTTLRKMVRPSPDQRHRPPTLGGTMGLADIRMGELLSEDRSAVVLALDAIAESLANFARRCVEAGADGIFLSVRDEWVDTPGNGSGTYDEMVRAGDLEILLAVSAGRCNVLHTCGVSRDFDAFAEYPVHAIHWADRAAGPAISEVIGRIRPAVCGGVDNLSTLPRGTPHAVADEVREALRQAGDCPMMIAPGCTFDPDCVPPENLDAMVQAARDHRY